LSHQVTAGQNVKRFWEECKERDAKKQKRKHTKHHFSDIDLDKNTIIHQLKQDSMKLDEQFNKKYEKRQNELKETEKSYERDALHLHPKQKFHNRRESSAFELHHKPAVFHSTSVDQATIFRRNDSKYSRARRTTLFDRSFLPSQNEEKTYQDSPAQNNATQSNLDGTLQRDDVSHRTMGRSYASHYMKSKVIPSSGQDESESRQFNEIPSTKQGHKNDNFYYHKNYENNFPYRSFSSSHYLFDNKEVPRMTNKAKVEIKSNYVDKNNQQGESYSNLYHKKEQIQPRHSSKSEKFERHRPIFSFSLCCVLFIEHYPVHFL